jgi:hypothetical protein
VAQTLEMKPTIEKEDQHWKQIVIVKYIQSPIKEACTTSRNSLPSNSQI